MFNYGHQKQAVILTANKHANLILAAACGW